ncbi:MAG: HesA/MoeB/ThiF family protein [Flammeovirgaceae bacterium]
MKPQFERHKLIPEWNQKKLEQALVIIVGMGALGNEVIRLLAFAGIRQFIICDPDQVSVSNLSRCSLFKETDIDQKKVDVVKQNLTEFIADLAIDTRDSVFINSIGLGEIQEADLVISAVDSDQTRIEIAGRCNLVQTPYIDGGTQAWGGEVRLFMNVEHACYACEQLSSQSGRASCSTEAVSPVIGASILMTSFVGSIMATFAIRHLMGLFSESFYIRVNGITGMTHKVFVKRDPNCMLHVPIQEEITLVPINREARIKDLLTYLPKQAIALLWHEHPIHQKCHNCGDINTDHQLFDRLQLCKKCGWNYMLHTETVLNQFPESFTLKEVGIPPKEMIPIHTNGEISYFQIQ